jgi:hypothetical protein
VSEIFKELVCYFIVVPIDEVKDFIFSDKKYNTACRHSNHNSQKESDAKIISRSFLEQG